MTRVLHVPKGGLPERSYPQEPDTAFCRMLRGVFFWGAGFLYLSLVVAWMFAWLPFSFMAGFGMGMMGAFIPIIGDRLIRPGKGRMWAITFAVVLCLRLIPLAGIVLLLVFPLGLLAASAIRMCRPSAKG